MTGTPSPMTGEQAAAYQRLRAHLAYLKLPTAAEQLPEVLDAARTENLSVTATLERLLAAEVPCEPERRRWTFERRYAPDEEPTARQALCRYVRSQGRAARAVPPGLSRD